MESRTLSYRNLVLSVAGSKIPLRLKIHLAPRTVRLLLAALPMGGNPHVSGSMTYINTEIKSKLERGRTEFNAGDVAFIPGERCLCFVTGPYATKRPMTPVGVMEGDVDILKSVDAADTVDIYEDTL